MTYFIWMMFTEMLEWDSWTSFGKPEVPLEANKMAVSAVGLTPVACSICPYENKFSYEIKPSSPRTTNLLRKLGFENADVVCL